MWWWYVYNYIYIIIYSLQMTLPTNFQEHSGPKWLEFLRLFAFLSPSQPAIGSWKKRSVNGIQWSLVLKQWSWNMMPNQTMNLKITHNSGYALSSLETTPTKHWRNPESPKDNTWQSLGLILSCNKVLMVDPDNYHTFALFDPSNMGMSMIPIIMRPSEHLI